MTGYGIAVDVARGLVVVSGCDDMQLYVYSLADGALVRSFGGPGVGPCQFQWDEAGLCLTCRGTLLVAECDNKRLQEVNVDDGSWVRFMGEAVLDTPDYVDCNATVIAVSETESQRVSLLSWTDGALLVRIGTGQRQLRCPRGLRLLADGGGVAVTNLDQVDELCFFSMAGEFVRSIAVGLDPIDVVEVDGGAGFIVVNRSVCTLSKVSVANEEVTPFVCEGADGSQFTCPKALAVVHRDRGVEGGSDVELVVLDPGLHEASARWRVFALNGQSETPGPTPSPDALVHPWTQEDRATDGSDGAVDASGAPSAASGVGRRSSGGPNTSFVSNVKLALTKVRARG